MSRWRGERAHIGSISATLAGYARHGWISCRLGTGDGDVGGARVRAVARTGTECDRLRESHMSLHRETRILLITLLFPLAGELHSQPPSGAQSTESNNPELRQRCTASAAKLAGVARVRDLSADARADVMDLRQCREGAGVVLPQAWRTAQADRECTPRHQLTMGCCIRSPSFACYASRAGRAVTQPAKCGYERDPAWNDSAT
jgi:hypothetical protein